LAGEPGNNFGEHSIAGDIESPDVSTFLVFFDQSEAEVKQELMDKKIDYAGISSIDDIILVSLDSISSDGESKLLSG